MIAFDRVVAILLRDVRCGPDQVVEHPQVRTGLVGGHFNRRRPVAQGSRQEPAGRGGVALSDSSTSMTWPYWSTARYRYRHRPAIFT